MAHPEVTCLFGQEQFGQVSFAGVTQEALGVWCHAYKVEGEEDTRDIALVTIEPGAKTPLQRVLSGDRTIEGYVFGKGTLTVYRMDGTLWLYSVSGLRPQPFFVEIKVGELMQWQADPNSRLTFWEICYPPYQDGRHENLPE